MNRLPLAARIGALASGALLAGACSPTGAAAPGVVLQPGERAAWIASDPATGERILIEPLAPAAGAAAAPVSEDSLLARVAQLAAGQAWYRVHELGAAALAAPGRVIDPAGQAWEAPPPLPRAGARERLLYLGLVRGAEEAVGVHPHRTRLVAGSSAAPKALTWERDGRTLALQARAWTNRERADFLGDSGVPAASESGSSAQPEPPHEHE